MEQAKGFRNKVTGLSLLIALGIIYGDIGTSPLYVFKAIIGVDEISKTLVFGGVSCVFWTLVFQTSIKYVWLTLKADNEGEGGVFSLYSLVRRYGKKLVIPTMIGASALLADGIITPAVTVTSAIEGLGMVKGLDHLPVVFLVFLIISGVFFMQRFGTEKVGKIFGPIMSVWFFLLFIMGFIWVVKYPEIIGALSPHYGYELLVYYPHGFWLLGAVFLCTTGAEALYSDMGHCGRKNIRITWGFVKVCLVMNYLGQAAWLMHQENPFLDGRNPFFEIIPSWFLIPGIIIATLAAIVASQALISGSFTLISEAMNLNFWQRAAIRQPTETKGQIYIPSINFILWVGCIFVVFFFQTSARMEAAYGLAITIAMLMTTFLLYYFLRYRLKWNKWTVALLMSGFLLIELSFLTANIVKFKEGGYITILVGGVFFVVMYITYFGKKINNRSTKFTDLGKYAKLIEELSTDNEIPKYATHLVFLTKSGQREMIEETVIHSILNKQPKRADVYWYFHINRTDNPYTLNYEVTELLEGKMLKIVLNIGFRVPPRTELYFKHILTSLIRNKEFGLDKVRNSSFKYNHELDFKFIVIEKFLSVENEFGFLEGIIIKMYYLLKKYAQKDVQAFGLDKSDVLIEQIPFVFQPVHDLNLIRRHH
ncbi:MAG: KUP/HAK/KT family potassium transporter [Weeksellaceae bacterium]